LVGSYTDSIYTLEFDPAPSGTPSLRYLSKVNVGNNPSWIEAHPSDRSLVFACLEQAPEGHIVVVKYDKDGNGHKVEEATCSSGGADPCTLSVTESELVIGNYSSGTLATVPISTCPPYTRPAELWKLVFPFEAGKSGRNLSRQEASHPHQTVFNPLNVTERELFVSDLGSDKVWRLIQGFDGHWVIRGSIDVDTGRGPRHIAIYGNTLYILLELTSELAAYKFHSAQQPLTTVSTLKQSPTPSQMAAGEILIPKPNRSFPTAYIYTSNRDDPHPAGDTIAIFSLEMGEDPELATEVRTGLRHVRGMMFGGEDDRWLIVGGVGSAGGGGIKVYERVKGGKELQQIAELDQAVGSKIKATSFLWL